MLTICRIECAVYCIFSVAQPPKTEEPTNTPTNGPTNRPLIIIDIDIRTTKYVKHYLATTNTVQSGSISVKNSNMSLEVTIIIIVVALFLVIILSVVVYRLWMFLQREKNRAIRQRQKANDEVILNEEVEGKVINNENMEGNEGINVEMEPWNHADHGQDILDESIVADINETAQNDQLNNWLTSISSAVSFSQYYDLFRLNGYESLDIIQEIQTKQELIEIGIKLKGHQTKLLAEIQKLKQRDMYHH